MAAAAAVQNTPSLQLEALRQAIVQGGFLTPDKIRERCEFHGIDSRTQEEIGDDPGLFLQELDDQGIVWIDESNNGFGDVYALDELIPKEEQQLRDAFNKLASSLQYPGAAPAPRVANPGDITIPESVYRKIGEAHDGLTRNEVNEFLHYLGHGQDEQIRLTWAEIEECLNTNETFGQAAEEGLRRFLQKCNEHNAFNSFQTLILHVIQQLQENLFIKALADDLSKNYL